MPATVPPRLTSSWLLPGKNTFKHCHFSSHCHQHLSSLPALPSLLILQPLPSCFQGITCIPSLSSPKRLLTSPVAEMVLPIRVPSIEPTCKFGNIEEKFSFFVLNMYQQDCQSHKAGQDIVFNFDHHTKLSKLHPSSSKVFLQLRFLHTLSLDLYDWISTICICCLP